jgi:DNA-binding transcriptional LysR family regulator
MISTDDLRFFAAISTAPSLASAARALNVSPPAVTQRLRNLEERLGVRLVERSSRNLTLTEEGELLAQQGGDVLAALHNLDDALADRRAEVTGKLRIVASLGFGRCHVAPVVAKFQAEFPKVKVDLLLSDRLGRIPEDAWDLAIQVGGSESAPPSLNMIHLAPNERLVCASRAYLARCGVPTAPEDLRKHSCIVLRENDADVTLWRFKPEGRSEQRIRIDAELATNDGEVARAWALAGHGIISRSEWHIGDDIRAGRLVQLLPAYPLPTAPIIALLGSRQQARAARTRFFLKRLQSALTPTPWRLYPT